MKKGIMLLSGLACATLAFGLVACDEGDPHECPQYVTYTIALTSDSADAVVSDAKIQLVQGEGEDKKIFAKGVTDEEGKFTGTAQAGEYVIEYLGGAGMYWSLGEEDKQTITISEDTTEIEVVMTDSSPNGTQARPYVMTAVNIETHENVISVDAGKTVYYSIQAMNSKIALNSTSAYKVIYKGETHTPVEGLFEIEVETVGRENYELVGIVFESEIEYDTAYVAVSYPQPEPEAVKIAVNESVNIVLNEANGYSVVFTLDNVSAGNYTVTLSNYVGESIEIDIESAADTNTSGEYVAFSNGNGSDVLIVSEGDTVLKVYPWGEPTGEYTFTIVLTAATAA